MKVRYDGRDYTLSFDNITLAQAIEIKNRIGFTIKGFEDKLAEGDIDAFRVLFWVMMIQSGHECDLDTVDFKLPRFLAGYEQAMEREHEVHIASESRLIADRVTRPNKMRRQDISRVKWLNADPEVLRSKYLFDMAAVCGIDAATVDQLRFTDFAAYCASIDQYHKNEEAKFKAQIQSR